MSEPTERNGTEFSFANRLFDAAVTVDRYYTPLLVLFGTIGNSLSLAVFCLNSKYRNQSASYYLSALSVSDTGYLVSLLAVWLEHVFGGVITSGVMCPLVMYLGQVTCFMSVYLTVSFSIERYVAVNCPLARPRICTRAKARKVIAILAVAALLLFSYAWVIARVIEIPSSRYDLEVSRNNESASAERDENLASTVSVVAYSSERKDATKNDHSLGHYDTSTESIDFSSELDSTSNFGKVFLSCDERYVSYKENGLIKSDPENCGRISNLTENSPMNFGHVYYTPEFSEVFTQPPADYENSLDNGERVETILGSAYICSVPMNYYRVSEIANYLDTLITLIIPFALIAFFNVQIAICVWKFKKERQKIVSSPLSAQGNNHFRHDLWCTEGNGRNALSSEMEQAKASGSFSRNDIPKLRSSGTNIKANPCCLQLKDAHARKFKTSLSSKISEDDSGIDIYCCTHFPNGDVCGSEDRNIRLSGKEKANFNRFDVATTRFNWRQENSFPSQMASSSDSVTYRRALTFRGSCYSSTANATEIRVTKTLFLISIIFVVLNLPAHAVRCAQFIQMYRGESEGNELLHAAQLWTNILFNTNFAINFLLYCVSGRNFRQSLKNMILQRFPKKSLRVTWKHASKKSISVTGTSRGCKSEFQTMEIIDLPDKTKPPVCATDNRVRQGNARSNVTSHQISI